MFGFIVFILLAVLLFLSTGAAIYMGIFKSHNPKAGKSRKLLTALVSYGISGVFWYFAYGYHYLGF